MPMRRTKRWGVVRVVDFLVFGFKVEVDWIVFADGHVDLGGFIP